MRIIIADDSSLLRERIVGLLTCLKYVSIEGEAASGTEALKLVSEQKPDVAIIDIRMPEMNGIEVLKRIKDMGLKTKVIILTNYPYRQYREKCLSEGADYFLDKNQDLARIVSVISEIEENAVK
jgi:two-component system, NarL family, response regulator DegU